MAELSGIKRAAILMIALGSETSSKIMKQLPESMIQQVSYEIANTDYVSPEERDEVMNEFVNTAQARQYVLDGGIEYARNLLNQALGPQKAKEVIDVLNQIQLRERPFDIARKADEKQLLNLLLEEQPQTIALIMCYLQPDKAASVLAELPTELQAEVAERIGSISSTSPWVIKAIEHVMNSKFTSFDESETEKVGGVNTLVNILNSASRSTEKNIIDDLEKRQPELGAEVKANLFTFDDIITLEGRDVQKVLRDVPNDVLELALKGSSEGIKEFIFKNLSTRAADNIREDLEYMGPVRLSSVEEAQQKVVAVIRRLDDAGEIYIGRGEQDAVVK
ncbi:flagellar motor switch protein FliG [Ligilactobacillus ruminis DPC 6832]|uniref:Flagellar motor switch protein FliG n=1 Tax=Ligilactobacillus ruminis DPC 6832 TaxID=1402208 RepID=A0A837DYX5_9LACO|nr:flagellar motor switch protein FliG [Ligilactobacillus ruminis]KIC05393.1 flagellar motor switch protein FliG [Ligilactobacillus ruminis DPC 6832]